ncbi:nucleotidyl transferase AbiEii/AbiGii toxin family protein [Corynebacterium sp.]|uniref:nucleotidyl transferase AbiEii/AbiGii toxin family protein n=1 Tax=Corynebacterium sp. TaxID=1720 RepID=UPI0026DFB232|nr:nucleotidyl transferase AbiEii/AbiGii toxin family protein [Corynebacterium sp.]MDO5512697.1 nucleotidyl transferase AbiEii/AbiGii toxin family protein [Corynebacterium sp.]
MSDEKSYSSPAALLSAVSARAKKDAKERGVPAERLIREFEFSRLLARVFAEGSDRWILKGGQAMLVRLPDPRTTKDIDLLHHVDPSDLDAAVDHLREALARDLGDYFRFDITKVDEVHENDEQTGVQCRRVTVAVRCGAKEKHPIQIDIAADSLMTEAPVMATFPAVELPKVLPPTVAVYPAVDHIADKVCATQATYAHGRASSRERDMVDLVLFAVTHGVRGRAVRTAVEAEWSHRGIAGPARFDPPPNWRSRYPKTARKVSALTEYADFDSASRLLSDFLDPALSGAVDGHTWNPETVSWEQQ